MRREGTKVKHVKCDGVSFVEIKRLLPPGFSLSAFGALTGLKEEKLLFNFEWLDSLHFLKTKKLPSDAAQWVSRLTGKGPTQAEVDQALEFFDRMQFEDAGAYLCHYLNLDVIILARATEKLFAGYFSLLGLHPIDCKKASVSSLSFYASQMALFADKRPGQFFCNDPVLHSLLKNATRGGITCVMRSFGGRKVDVGPFVDLYRRQKEWEEETRQDPLAEDGAAAAAAAYPAQAGIGQKRHSSLSDQQIADFLTRCNSHVLASPEDSSACKEGSSVTYLDINSRRVPGHVAQGGR
jgi:hypothetical protein